MTASVTLDGNAVSTLTLAVPAWGCWWADVGLPDAIEIDVGASVRLDVGGQPCVGTVVTGGALDGRAAYRIVGGANGWSKTVQAKGYRNTTGVRTQGVLRDLAEAVGESVTNLDESTLGELFTRPGGGAYRTLNAIAPQAWYVLYSGVTAMGARPAYAYQGQGIITRRDRALGVVELDVQTITDLRPGVQVDGNEPATDLEIVLAGPKLTARVYYAPASSRRLRAFAKLLDALDPRRLFRGVFEYRVVSQSGDRLDLQSVRAANGLPDLRGVPIRPGMAGLRADVALGSLVLVGFADADPSRPAVLSHAAPDAPGWMPTLLELGGPGALGVARLGDSVVAGAFGGTVTSASTTIKAAG